MDQSTLSSLHLAFNSAPSAELAKVLLLNQVSALSVDELQPYIDQLASPMPPEDIQQYCDACLDHQAYQVLANIFAKLELNEVKAGFDYAQKHYPDLAQQLRTCIQEIRPDALLRQNANETEDPVKPDARAKLKLVEKTDWDEVTDLTSYREKSTNFDDVVGLEQVKKQITKKIILPFQKPSLFQRFKKKIGGGVLLYGPPGCGKTLLARATAGQCNANFYNIEISDVLDMYIGESEQKLHAIFTKARSDTPCVLFFDEIEALAGKREHTKNSSTNNIVSQFLTELDGFAQNNEGVLVLASTNVPWAIDNAFLRPGRFDRMFFVPPPDKVAREAIIQHHLIERPHSPNIDAALLANKTPGHSGADLFNLVEMAADEAIEDALMSDQDTEISMAHFKKALQDSRATTQEWLTTARNYARYANDGGRYNDVLDFLKKHGKA